MSTFITSFLVGVLATAALADFRDVSVAEHNKYRASHGAPPVSRDAQIDQKAQNYARYLAENEKFEHSSDRSYGENLYMAYGGSTDLNDHVRAAVKNWYDEIKDYDFSNPGFSYKTGHFTAVVWKKTKKIGTGAYMVDDARYGHRVVVVVNYTPPGNYMGQFAENVLASSG